MKKTIKILSVILSVIMMFAVVPFSAIAETLTPTWADETLLMSQTALFDASDASVDAKVDGLEVSHVAGNTDLIEVNSEDKSAIKVTEATKTWLYCGGMSTNLALNNTSKYTIEMKVHFSNSGRAMIGFNTAEAAEIHAVHFDKTELQTYYGIYNSSGNSGRRNKYTQIMNAGISSMDKTQTQNLTFEINGYVISVYIDGVKHGEWDYGETSEASTAPAAAWDTTLGIFVTAMPSAELTTSDTVIKVSDINIYAGNKISNAIAEETLTGDWDDGTVLLQKNGLFNTDTVSKVEGLEITEIAPTATDVSKDMDEDSFTATADTTAWMPLGGISTNLKMDESSRYTIEMDVNFADSGRAMIGFVGNELSKMHAFYFNGTTLTDAYGIHSSSGWSGRNSKYTSSDKQATPTSKNKNDCTLQFEINGYIVSVYIEGTKYGEFNFGESSAPTTAPEGWDSTLGIAVTAVPTYKAEGEDKNTVHDGESIIEVKNITVYAGNVAGPKITFEKEDGTILGVQSATIGDEITEFPEVEAPEGMIVKWFHKGTNIVVNTPYVVSTAKATLVAKVIDLNEIKVAGMQYTDVSSANTQSIRFIASIHTLQAMDTGFVVTAKYMEGGVLKNKEFKVNSKTVYTSITATESGTVKHVAAEDLGGTYLIAISVDDVPTTIGQIDFYVTALLKVSDTVTGESTEAIFSMKDGEFLENASLLK